MNYGVNQVPGHLCSHVNLAYIELDEQSWRIKEDAVVNFTSFTQIKRNYPRLKTLLSIGGWSNETAVISNMAQRRSTRREFVKGIVKSLVDLGFDGLDVFWLFPGHAEKGGRPIDKRNYVSLLKELKAAFKGRRLLLTAGVPLNQYILERGYDIPAITRYVDWMNVIGYDLRGYWNDRTDIHSPLFPRSIDGDDVKNLNVREGMQHLLDAGALKRKLVLGVSFYGRVYHLADRSNRGLHAPIDKLNRPQPGAFLNSDNIHAYFEICLNVKGGDWVRSFDNEGKCPYATNGEDWVGYEDAESIAEKVKFVRSEGFAGVMVLSCDMDDFRGLCGPPNVLLDTINELIPLRRPNLLDPRRIE